MPFSGESRPTKSTCGGSSGSPTDSGISTGEGTTRTSRAPSSRAAPARYVGGDDREPRPPQQRPEEPRRAPRELDVRAPELHHVRLPGLQRRERGRQPVRVDEVGVARGPARGPRIVEEERRQQQRQPRPPAQVPHHAVAVGDPEVAERRGRDDLDLDTLRAHGLDGVADEEAGHVPLVARVRSRQDDDLHWQPAREDDRRRQREQREREEVVERHRQVEGVRRDRPDERGRHPPRERAHARRLERAADRAQPPEPLEQVDEEARRRAPFRSAPSRRASRRRTSAGRSSSGR